jgi:hypothetical protein
MTAPNTRNWSANELSDLVGRHYHIEVHGEVETSATNYSPKLAEHVPQGINPRILLLDLTIVKTAEFGGQIVEYHKVAFEHPTSGHQYDEVDILFDGEIIERIKVGHPKTVAAAAPKKPAASKAAEKSAKKKPAKKKPAKKKAAKKAPAKKKGAKKAAKKSTKKKSAKKTAARSKK